jgi:hypothetical protein
MWSEDLASISKDTQTNEKLSEKLSEKLLRLHKPDSSLAEGCGICMRLFSVSVSFCFPFFFFFFFSLTAGTFSLVSPTLHRTDPRYRMIMGQHL